METLDNEVRSHIYAVLEGEASIEDLEAWFAECTWDNRTPLIATIDHLLAERSVLDPAAVLAGLRTLARTIVTVQDRRVAFGATAETIRPQAIHTGGNETIRARLEPAGR